MKVSRTAIPFGYLPLSRPLHIGLTGLMSLLLSTSVAWGGRVEGFTEPYHDIDLSSTGEPARIAEIHAREGEQVRAGDVLAVLDTAVLESSLAIAQRRATMTGRLAAAQAEMELRKTRAGKLRTLRSQGHASPVETARAETDLAVAEANVRMAQEERELAALECRRIEAQIERLRLRSPIDGIVVQVHREVGESTQISDALMVRLVQLSKLRVKFPVSVRHASQLQGGDILPVTMPEISRQTDAVVEVVSPVLDAKSGTVLVTCIIDNSAGDIRSGMRCLMEVQGAGDPALESEREFSF